MRCKAGGGQSETPLATCSPLDVRVTVHVSHLALIDFRSYAQVEIAIPAGVSAFIGPNGQGKTNLVEAIDYVATQSSHRVASDQPLVRFGADQAIVRTHGPARRPAGADRAGDQPRPGQPGPAQPRRRPAGPRRARASCARCCSHPTTSSWSRATRVPGGASSTTCWSRGSRGSPASAPTTTGCSSSATPC